MDNSNVFKRLIKLDIDRSTADFIDQKAYINIDRLSDKEVKDLAKDKSKLQDLQKVTPHRLAEMGIPEHVAENLLSNNDIKNLPKNSVLKLSMEAAQKDNNNFYDDPSFLINTNAERLSKAGFNYQENDFTKFWLTKDLSQFTDKEMLAEIDSQKQQLILEAQEAKQKENPITKATNFLKEKKKAAAERRARQRRQAQSRRSSQGQRM